MEKLNCSVTQIGRVQTSDEHLTINHALVTELNKYLFKKFIESLLNSVFFSMVHVTLMVQKIF